MTETAIQDRPLIRNDNKTGRFLPNLVGADKMMMLVTKTPKPGLFVSRQSSSSLYDSTTKEGASGQ